MGKWGWIAAFIYCVGAALRLARFNTNIEVVDKRFFQGLPSPAAAALIAGFVWVLMDLNYTGEEVRWYAWALTIFAGVTMVSNFRYYSGKDINLRRSVPFIAVLAIVLFFVLVSSYPPGILFALFLCYAFSGYIMAVLDWVRRTKNAGLTPLALTSESGYSRLMLQIALLLTASLLLSGLLLARPLLRRAR